MNSKRRKPKPCRADSGALSTVILAGLLLSLTALTGCASKIIIHPITAQDIVFLKQGETISAPKEGAFLSSEYISEVMKIKVEK